MGLLFRKLYISLRYLSGAHQAEERYREIGKQYTLSPPLVEMALAFHDTMNGTIILGIMIGNPNLILLRKAYIHMGFDMWSCIERILLWFYAVMKNRPEKIKVERRYYKDIKPVFDREPPLEKAIPILLSQVPELAELLIVDTECFSINPAFTQEECEAYYRLMQEQMPNFPMRYSRA